MRKFSKILTVLLTLALLCGVVMSVFASAEEAVESREVLNVSKSAYNKYSDYESKDAEGNYYLALTGQNMPNVKSDYPTVNGNTYGRYTSKGNSTSNAKNAEPYIYLADYGWNYLRNGATNVGAYDYVVIDFEIGTDKYSYKDADGAYHTVDSLAQVPAEYAASADLALVNGMCFDLHGRGAATISTRVEDGAVKNDGSSNSSEVWPGVFRLYTVKGDDGAWYLSTDAAYSANDVKFADNAGEFAKVTFVIKVGRKADTKRSTGYNLGDSRGFTFIDGQLVNESYIYSGYDAVAPAWIRLGLEKNQYKDMFSICFDNVAINWYGGRSMVTTTTPVEEGNVTSRTTYTYSTVETLYKSEGYGIDDYITSGDYKTLGLWNCEDVAYGKDYVDANGKTNIGIAFEALDNGDIFTIKESFENATIRTGILGFTVVAEDGAKFSLSAASAARYDVTEAVDGTTTTYVVAAKTSVLVNETKNMTGGTNTKNFDNYDNTSGTWTAYRGSGVAKETVAGANGNKYMRLTIQKAGVALDNEVYENSSAQVGPASNPKFSDYKYTTIDVDLAVDSYVYSWTEEINGQTATKYSTSLDDIPEGVTPNKGDLAYYSGFYYYLRSNASGANPSNSGLMNVTTGKDASTGLYYVTSGNAGGKKITLANEIGVFDHYTFVLASKYDASGAFVGADIYCYVNGELLYHVYNTSNVVASQYLQKLTMTYNYSLSGVNKYYPQPEGAADNKENTVKHFHEFNDKYSVLFDNYAVNLYAENSYKTQYLDAFFGEDFDENASLTECDGVVYNKNYVGPNETGKYLEINGTKIYNVDAFASQVGAVKNGAVVVTNADLLNVTPTGDKTFTVKLVDGAKFTLSEAATKALWFTSVEGDTVTVYCRASEATTFNFVDVDGNVLDSSVLLLGMSLDVSGKNSLIPETFDKATGSVVGINGWTIDLGNGAIDANGYVLDASAPKEITVTPTIGAIATINTYAIYVVDENGVATLVGDVSDYASMDSFKTNIQKAPDGATAILLYDDKYDIGVQTVGRISIGAGKTFSLDLNGRTLIDGYSNTNVGAWGGTDGCAFNVGEGSTFNFYSSKPGAAWYQIKYSSSGDSRIYSKGIVTSTAKKATVNFGTVCDEDGNVIIESADFDVYGSLILASKVDGATKENTEYNINVNGGNYYGSTGIGRYAMIVSYLPVTNITVNNATLINDSRDGYGIFSTWFHNSVSNIEVYNSTLIAVGDSSQIVFDGYHKVKVFDKDGNPVMITQNGKEVQKEDDVTDTVEYNHYYENCVIIASKYGNNGYKGVTLGAGNYVSNMAYLGRAEGVNAMNASTSIRLANYPKAINALPTAETNSFKAVEIGGTTYYTIADSFYDTTTWVNKIQYVASGYFTYTDEIPEKFACDEVNYTTADGAPLTTVLWLKSRVDNNFAKAHPIRVNLGMYTATEATWSATEDATKFVLAGYTGVTANFKDMLVNASLSTGMTYNIYIPADAGITVTSVEGGKLSDKLLSYNGRTYYIVSVELAAAEFDAKSVVVNFSTKSLIDGAELTGNQTLKADIVGYATKVSESYSCGTEEAALIVNMMEYKYAVAMAVYAYAGGNLDEFTVPEAVEAFLAEHADCGCADAEIIDPEVDAYLDELVEAGLEGATFTMSEIGVISLVFESENAELDVWVSYNITEETKLSIKAEYNEEAKCYITPGISAAYIDNLFTITVGEATGTYSLANFIAEAGDEITEFVAISLAQYAAAAEAYKFVLNEEVE